jgi:hypothetical protein
LTAPLLTAAASAGVPDIFVAPTLGLPQATLPLAHEALDVGPVVDAVGVLELGEEHGVESGETRVARDLRVQPVGTSKTGVSDRTG